MAAHPPPRWQYTSVRKRIADGEVLIGLKHTAKDEAGEQVKLPWIEMPPADLARLVKTLQDVLASQPAQQETTWTKPTS